MIIDRDKYNNLRLIVVCVLTRLHAVCSHQACSLDRFFIGLCLRFSAYSSSMRRSCAYLARKKRNKSRKPAAVGRWSSRVSFVIRNCGDATM